MCGSRTVEKIKKILSVFDYGYFSLIYIYFYYMQQSIPCSKRMRKVRINEKGESVGFGGAAEGFWDTEIVSPQARSIRNKRVNLPRFSV